MTDSELEFLKLHFAISQDKEMARLRAYLESGRRLKDIPVEDLKGRWVEANKRWHSAFAQAEIDAIQELECELKLRNVVPPIELIEADMEAGRQRFAKMMEPVLQDPARVRAANREILEEMAQFLIASGEAIKN